MFPDLAERVNGTEVALSEVEYLDIRFGNLCNLKCRMCSPYSSSAWMSDWEKLGDLVEPIPEGNQKRLSVRWYEDPALIESFRALLPGLREVYLTGGEAMLSRGNKMFLRLCEEEGRAGSIRLRYNTNGTIFDEEMVRTWESFEHVHLKISIDGIGPLNDYIRHPSRWDELLRNLERYISLQSKMRLLVTIQTVFQAYNALNIDELIHFFTDRGLFIQFENVFQPDFLSASVLGPERARLAREKILTLPEFPQKSFLLEQLDSSGHGLWGKFLAYTDRLDEIRGQRAADFIPALF